MKNTLVSLYTEVGTEFETRLRGLFQTFPKAKYKVERLDAEEHQKESTHFHATDLDNEALFLLAQTISHAPSDVQYTYTVSNYPPSGCVGEVHNLDRFFDAT